ncbi:MAG: bifunctional diaminohydroxyphosphoribosylaminopyrimidine deaminase/5-amino-6-(5-phosphoribosylamino)uracil reductase RibD [Candidatus Sulfotelmatobacter sp.]
MPDRATDEQFLQRALDEARRGTGLASPGPYIGAIIVDSGGRVAGTGFYTYDRVKHAEVLALEQAGANARGGTLYINLEPHCHQGRTPPCTDALIEAGIRRVVACMPDPNPKVSGKGFEQLRTAGIAVDVGGFESEARRLNEAFARYIRNGIPLVTLKSAMTLDGKIAPPPGAKSDHKAGIPPGGWITGETARANVHEQRHQSDAILVGIGTILADDPLLTDRSGRPRQRPLLRVILDSHLRLPLNSRLVQSVLNNGTPRKDVLVFYCRAEENKKKALEGCGIQIEQLPQASSDARLDMHAVVRRLGKLEITSLMIEGGASVNGSALAAGIVDKVFLYYAPKIMALDGSIPFASGAALSGPLHTPQVEHLQIHRFAEDFAAEGYLRDPYDD